MIDANRIKNMLLTKPVDLWRYENRIVFAHQLRVIMASEEMTAALLAARSGVPEPRIVQFTWGSVAPNEGEIADLCRVLECSRDWLTRPEYIELRGRNDTYSKWKPIAGRYLGWIFGGSLGLLLNVVVFDLVFGLGWVL